MRRVKDASPNLFEDVFEAEAIENIRKFARIAKMEGLPVELGFSGGKDSIVCHSLCKRAGIAFTPVFQYAFEAPEVVAFIRENYPDVIIRKREKSYFQMIKEKRFLPSNRMRFCCQYFKENSKDIAVITGVRREESAGRRGRKMFGIKRKRDIKKYADIFSADCTETEKSALQLRPILYFSEAEVWRYIKKYGLPYPKLYDEGLKRCGCMLCPLAQLKPNMFWLKRYPNMLSSFNRNVFAGMQLDRIWNKGKDSEEDLSNDPYRFLLYWLSSSFRPSKKDRIMIDRFLNEMNETIIY